MYLTTIIPSDVGFFFFLIGLLLLFFQFEYYPLAVYRIVIFIFRDLATMFHVPYQLIDDSTLGVFDWNSPSRRCCAVRVMVYYYYYNVISCACIVRGVFFFLTVSVFAFFFSFAVQTCQSHIKLIMYEWPSQWSFVKSGGRVRDIE